jgi:hypothetical protein
MTYLDMINSILKRLRERTVSTANETDYSTLIGQLINDAKNEIETAWDWSALRTTLTAQTQANIVSYSLTGSGQDATIESVINDTTDYFLTYRSNRDFDNWYLNTSTPATGSPQYYNINGVDINNDLIMDFYPRPTGVENIRINLIVRTPDMVLDTDFTIIPARPVEMLAYAKAVEERGEDGGAMAQNIYATANRVISDAIARDGQYTPENLIYAPV